MELSISNIGWTSDIDEQVFRLMKKYGYSGLEIAPTRVFPESPYKKLKEASRWSQKLKRDYGFSISSMQSIWFGRQEKLFGSIKEREVLLDYTKHAIDFAVAINCKNLVFGCPINRSLPDGVNPQVAVEFFKKIGDYAAEVGTVIGMEANPQIYNTNYINDTMSALNLIKQVNSVGFLLNLDVGTIIQNEESLDQLKGNVKYINHVHISEPRLKPIKERRLHKELLKILRDESYDNFVSIEMGKIDELSVIKNTMKYVRSLFIYE